VSCTLSGIVGGDDVHCTSGVAEFERRVRGAGKPVTVERADARRRGGGELHAGPDGDDDRHDHGGESDGDGDGGPKPYDGR
jgi:hypothetical protein